MECGDIEADMVKIHPTNNNPSGPDFLIVREVEVMALVIPCLVGEHFDNTVVTKCSSCPAGSYCPLGCVTPVACPIIQTSAPGSGSRKDCVGAKSKSPLEQCYSHIYAC